MYACILETGRGFFEGVCVLSDQTRISPDPPPPCRSCIASCQYYLRVIWFLPLTAVNAYSLLRYLVVGNKLQGGEISRPPLPWGRLCDIPYVDFGEFAFQSLGE